MRTIIALSFATAFSLSANVSPSLVSRISFFTKIPQAPANPKYTLTHGNRSTTCTANQNLRISHVHDQVVAWFFSASSETFKKPSPLVAKEIETLKQITQKRLVETLSANSKNRNDECENLIASLEGHFTFLYGIYKKGYVVSSDGEISNLLKRKVLDLSPTFEVVEFMAKNLLNFYYMDKLNARITPNSGFALFLFSKTFETNNVLFPEETPATTETLKREYSRMLLSYQRYLDVFNFATESSTPNAKPQIKSSDYLATYVELDLIEKNPEHASIMREQKQFDTRAYLRTLHKLADLFPDFTQASSEYRLSFSKLFMAEELANTVAKERISPRIEIMAYIPVTETAHINKLAAASNELRKHILNNTKNDSLSTKERLQIASHVLRLSKDITRLNPKSMAQVVMIREDLQTQLNDGKSIVQVRVNGNLVQGI